LKAFSVSFYVALLHKKVEYNMVNIVIAKPPPEGTFQNNSEVWMQGPEPYTTKIVDATNDFKLVNSLAPDQWYDFYARAPSNATGDAGVAVITINIPGFPVSPNNTEPYDIWMAAPSASPIRNTSGIEGIAAGPIPAGQTQYIGSMLFTSPNNTVQPPNPRALRVAVEVAAVDFHGPILVS
jgi:hypothetical protein